MREHGTLHIPEVRAQNDFPIWVQSAAYLLGAPLRQKGNSLDMIARRIEVRPFTRRRSTVGNLADQAVIAVENVRLFHELKESSEQQTATSESWGHR